MNDLILIVALVIVFSGIGYTIADTISSFKNIKT